MSVSSWSTSNSAFIQPIYNTTPKFYHRTDGLISNLLNIDNSLIGVATDEVRKPRIVVDTPATMATENTYGATERPSALVQRQISQILRVNKNYSRLVDVPNTDLKRFSTAVNQSITDNALTPYLRELITGHSYRMIGDYNTRLAHVAAGYCGASDYVESLADASTTTGASNYIEQALNSLVNVLTGSDSGRYYWLMHPSVYAALRLESIQRRTGGIADDISIISSSAAQTQLNTSVGLVTIIPTPFVPTITRGTIASDATINFSATDPMVATFDAGGSQATLFHGDRIRVDGVGGQKIEFGIVNDDFVGDELAIAGNTVAASMTQSVTLNHPATRDKVVLGMDTDIDDQITGTAGDTYFACPLISADLATLYNSTELDLNSIIGLGGYNFKATLGGEYEPAGRNVLTNTPIVAQTNIGRSGIDGDQLLLSVTSGLFPENPGAGYCMYVNTSAVNTAAWNNSSF